MNFLLLLAITAMSVVYAASVEYSVVVVEKQKLTRLTVTVQDPSGSVAKLKRMFQEEGDPSFYYPPICAVADGNELDPFEPVSKANQDWATYVYVFARYEGKMYVLTVCPGTTYSQLRVHVARRLNLANEMLDIADIAFGGILREGDVIAERTAVDMNRPTKMVRFQVGSPFVSVCERERRRPTRPQMEQLTGTSVELDIPRVGKCAIENVDLEEGTVGQLRAAIEAKFGADANHHNAMAICDGDDEAGDGALLSTVFQNTSSLSPKAVSIVDWSTGVKREYKVAYCPNSTFKDALSRALPSWKTILDDGNMLSVMRVEKEEEESKADGPLITAEPISLSDKVADKATDKHIFCVTLEGALLLTVAGWRRCVGRGYVAPM